MARTITAKDVAEYFLDRATGEADDLISNLKLQKLVYYAQGVHLVYQGEPMFSDSIQAWTPGPVVPALYHEYKGYGDGPIPANPDFDPEVFTEKQLETLDAVYEAFGQYSAWKLRNMTYEEHPWKSAYARHAGSAISNASMFEYFNTIVDAQYFPDHLW